MTLKENKLLQKRIAKKQIKKAIKRKGDKLYVKWKGNNNLFNSWIDKIMCINEWIFPKPNSLGANIKVELDLSNYATKINLKNTTGVDTPSFAKKNWFS